MTERSVRVKLTGDISDFNKAMLAASAGAKGLAKDLDTSNDRMSHLVQTSLALGPALVPIGAAAVPAIAGLTNQLAFAAAGAGVAALAFSGVGDALKAVNDYQLEPTAANFAKMQETLQTLGPAGQDFVMFLQDIRPELQGLQDAAQAGLFPGAEEGIRSLMTLLPQAESIVSEVAGALGDVIAEAGDNLADPRWADFFTFLETEARPTLIDMGKTLGNFAEGFANLWMAFAPVSNDFSKSFLDLARDFAQWTDGLDQTQGFQEFVSYIERVGPKAWDTLSALGNALLQIVEAAAPVGEATLPIITAVADVFATIADSDIGPVLIGAAAGISTLSRAVALFNTAQGSALTGLFGRSAFGGFAKSAKDLGPASRAYLDFGAALGSAGPQVGKFATTTDRLKASLRGAGGIAAGVGGLAFVMSDLDEKVGLSNTAMMTLVGSTLGPLGAAFGGAIGLTMDFAAANDDLWAAVDRANNALSQGPENLDAQKAALEDVNKQVSDLKSSVDVGAFELPSIGDGIKYEKNLFEGIFGKSDVEEAEEAQASLEKQYGANKRAAQDLKFNEAGLGSSMDGVSDATRDQTEALLDNIATHNNLANTLLKERGGLRAYEQAIDDADAAAKKNGKTLDVHTQAGRDNQAALDGLTGAWNELTPAQQNASGAADSARAAFIRISILMGRTKARAKELADQYLAIPPAVATEVRVAGINKAQEDVNTILNALNSINPFKDIYIRTHRSGDDAGNEARAPRKADGGLILGPGGPRDDLIPIMASNREFVVNAAATADHLPLLQAINAGQMRPFADGGHVGGVTVTAAAAPAMPTEFYMKTGALKIVDGDAYFEGIASAVVSGNDRFKRANEKAGR